MFRKAEPMDVFLHVGAHRTATTSFQRMMGASRDALLGEGIAYWGPKRTRGGLFNGFGDEPLAELLPWQARRLKRRVGRVKLAIAVLADDGCDRLVVSEENMLGTLRPCLAQAALYAHARPRLQQFSEAFGSRCRRVAIGIRCYDRFWASALGFSLGRGGPAPTKSVIGKIMAQPRRWRDVIQDVSRAFPEAEIVVWTHEALSNRPDAQAEALLGTPPPPLKHAYDWHNTIPSPAHLRELLMDRDEDPGLIKETGGRFMPFAALERATLRAQYAEDLAWLRSGADGLARYIDDPATDWGARGQGRGRSYDGENRRLA